MASKQQLANIQTSIVGARGYYFKKNEVTPELLLKIKKNLTVKPIVVPGYGPEEVESFTLYDEDDEYLYVPRYFGYKKLGKPKINVIPPGKAIDINFVGSLREYQLNILSAWDTEVNKYGGSIISVGPGRGKTVMAIAKIAEYKVKTLVLVFNSDLMDQWEERIKEYTPNARIGRIRGKEIAVVDKDIVIGMVQSLSNPKKDEEYPAEMFADFGMLIIDECHHIGARMFSRCLRKCSFKYLMGLSATPDRQDGLTKVLTYYLGDICFKDDSIQKTPEEQELEHLPDAKVDIYRYYSSDPRYSREIINYQRKPNVVVMESKITEYVPRTEFILGLLPPLIAEGRKIIILTSRRDHIAELLKKITDRQIATVGPYVGGMKPEHLIVSKTRQILVATYDMAEEGFDCQALDTLIMATPKKRIMQCAGRIMRKKKNERTHIPYIIDIADEFSKFKVWTDARTDFYADNNYKIAEYDVTQSNTTTATVQFKHDIPWSSTPTTKTKKKSKGNKTCINTSKKTNDTDAIGAVEYDLS